MKDMVWSILSAVAALSIQTAPAVQAGDSAALPGHNGAYMPETTDYTHTFWLEGFPGRLHQGKPWIRCIQTGAYAMAINTETLEIPHPVSWADAERDLSAWLGNPMQEAAHEALDSLYDDVREAADKGRPELLERWRKLSTSDHVYYMCTKGASDGEVHAHFSPYDTPHEAYVMFMNVLDDLARRVAAAA